MTQRHRNICTALQIGARPEERVSCGLVAEYIDATKLHSTCIRDKLAYNLASPSRRPILGLSGNSESDEAPDHVAEGPSHLCR